MCFFKVKYEHQENQRNLLVAKGDTKYFDIIKRNKEIYSTFDLSSQYPVWNLYDSKISSVPIERKELIKFPWCKYPTNTCSEVLVNLPHIPPEWLIEIKN